MIDNVFFIVKGEEGILDQSRGDDEWRDIGPVCTVCTWFNRVKRCQHLDSNSVITVIIGALWQSMDNRT